MSFKITNTKIEIFPNEETAILFSDIELSVDKIIEAIENFKCEKDKEEGVGYQQNLSKDLPEHLISKLNLFDRVCKEKIYTTKLKEIADLVVTTNDFTKKIFFEIEFRPNVEKDLIKFQIGYDSGNLAGAILIVAINRKEINEKYTTMPQYDKINKLIKELKPKYPLLLIGVSGNHL